jgi:hypothetical protein
MLHHERDHRRDGQRGGGDAGEELAPGRGDSHDRAIVPKAPGAGLLK